MAVCQDSGFLATVMAVCGRSRLLVNVNCIFDIASSYMAAVYRHGCVLTLFASVHLLPSWQLGYLLLSCYFHGSYEAIYYNWQQPDLSLERLYVHGRLTLCTWFVYYDKNWYMHMVV